MMFYVVTYLGARQYAIDGLFGFRFPVIFESEEMANDMAEALNAARERRAGR
jgi:hypothetical protein